MAVTTSELSSFPPNFGMAETYSYVPVSNDQNRYMTAKLVHMVNANEITLNMSASSVSIESVGIKDPQSGYTADVIPAGGGLYALRVITQDLDHSLDSVAIGDNSTVATVNPATSALRVESYTVPGFNLPTYTEIDMTYVGSTNNLNTVTYKNGVTTVAALSFAYVGGVPSANDAMLSTVIRTT